MSDSIMQWQSFGPGWRRASYLVPGYDCRVTCQHEHKGDHGIHNDEWIYVVSDGECAVSLRVGSGQFPPTVTHVESRPPRGWDLELHVPWTTDADKIREGREGQECAFIEAGKCFVEMSSISAGEKLFTDYGAPAFEQPESFWNALRGKAGEWIADEKQARAQMPRLRRCPCCGGRGVVEVEEPQR